MSIAISSFGADSGRSGIGQYLLCLLREFQASQAQAEVFGVARDRQVFLPHESPELRYREVPGVFEPLPANLLWHTAILPWQIRSHRVLWLPSVTRRTTPIAGIPRVGTVHDLANFHMADKYDPVRNFLVKFVVTPLLRSLDHILTVSEFSKRDIVELARVPEERVTVTPLGVNHGRYHAGDAEQSRARIQEHLGFDQPYILYVSRLEHPGKNHVRLLQAFDVAKTRSGLPHKLVLLGAPWGGAEAIYKAAEELTHKADVVFPGFLPDHALPDIYRATDLFVFPSLFEGFGLPVLEAMASGVPVACSDRASLPEVAGDAALMFNPTDVEQMAETLRLGLEDSDLRRDLIAAGLKRSAQFSWSRTAQATLNVLQSF